MQRRGEENFPAALPRVQPEALAPPLWGGEKENAGWVGGLTCPNPKGCRRGEKEGAKRRGESSSKLRDPNVSATHKQNQIPLPGTMLKREGRRNFPAALPRVQPKALAPPFWGGIKECRVGGRI